MKKKVRDIEQHFIRLSGMPEIELRSTWNSSQGYKAHSHCQLSIGLLHSGTTFLTCDGETQQLVAGDLVMIEPGRVHACNPGENGSRGYHMLYIDACWCLQWLSAFYQIDVSGFYCEQRLIRDPQAIAVFQLLIEQLQRSSPETSGALKILQPLATHLLLPYCCPVNADTDRDERCVILKQALLADLQHPPSLSELAAIIGCTAEAVIRMFKRHYGITPKAFVNNARIEKSKQLLLQGMAVVEVAGALGFSDQSQFHRTFVSYTASTPRQYQQG